MDQMPAAGLPQVTTVGGTVLPLAGRARVYACGITPYDVTHLGHAATFVWVDTLGRVLHADGTEVIVCRNVTDVDDVLLVSAAAPPTSEGAMRDVARARADGGCDAVAVQPRPKSLRSQPPLAAGSLA